MCQFCFFVGRPDAILRKRSNADIRNTKCFAPRACAKKPHQPMSSMPDGSLATNMKGAPLCSGFQAGACTTTSHGITCAHTGAMHQCSRCLSSDHGSKHPQQCNRSQKATKPMKQGKGGKGKGKGKW